MGRLTIKNFFKKSNPCKISVEIATHCNGERLGMQKGRLSHPALGERADSGGCLADLLLMKH